MKKIIILVAFVSLIITGSTNAGTVYVNTFGDQGWKSDDTRDSSGVDLVGINYTHYGKPGQTPTSADDTAIANQIKFVQDAPGGIAALKFDKASVAGGYSKCTLSTVNNTTGFAAGDSWVSSFKANYRYYSNSTAESAALKIGIQSIFYANSQSGFTALRSGESEWDLVLVDWRGTNPGWTVNAWDTFTTDKDTVCWYLYRQGGNSFFNTPPSGMKSLAQWATETGIACNVGGTNYTWAEVLFGSGAKVTSIQFGVGSSSQTSTTYIDWVETNLLNSGNRVDFVQKNIAVNVFPSSAPNGYGSPSWSGYMSKALYALENGLSTNGDRETDPTGYEVAGSIISPWDIAVTSFKSWRGTIDPPSPFNNELGNRLHFGLHAVGDGTSQFCLEDLTFSLHSSDETDSLFFDGDFIGYSYNGTSRYGIDWGTDRIKGTTDDIVYTSGNGKTPVDEIVYVGVGNAWWPAGDDPNPSNPDEGKQQAMDDYLAWIQSEGPIDVTCSYDILGASGNSTVTITTATLKLVVPETSIYIQPGESILVDMDVEDLALYVNSCQAMLGYSSTFFADPIDQGGTTHYFAVSPGGGVWDTLIYDSWKVGAGIPGEIDTAIGLNVESSTGTKADGTVAKITLTAKTGVQGTTKLTFRPDAVPDEGLVKSTFLSDMAHNPVWPVKLDSVNIYIDGINPETALVSVQQDGQDLLPPSTTNAIVGTVNITVTASDAFTGLAGNPVVVITFSDDTTLEATFVDQNPDGTFNYTFDIETSTPNGTATIDVTTTDKAGNEATDSGTININKNQITGTVSYSTLSSAKSTVARDVVFVATDAGGNILKTWTVSVNFVNDNVGPNYDGATGTYTLTDVPSGTVNLSAKTAWHLRKKNLSLSFTDGQATSNFWLLGGDINGSNSVNILDYSILKANWNTFNAVADINGIGGVNSADYNLMQVNWFKVGDQQ